MLKRMPVELNIPRLTANNASLRGGIKLNQFKRLADYLHTPGSGDLNLELTFSSSLAVNPERAHFTVSGQFQGDVKLECQRCTGTMDFHLAGAFDFVLVKTEADAESVGGIYEPVLMDEFDRIRSVDLIEDELILHIPIAPRHADGEQCIDESCLINTHLINTNLNSTDGKNNDERPGHAHPFDILKNLTV